MNGPIRLATYSDLSILQLQEKYELACSDLTNLHSELAELLRSIHHSYLEAFSRSHGKSVAEKNRDADFETSELYCDAIETRGKINRLSEQRDMIVNLINWKLNSISSIKPNLSETYPPNHDKERLGHG